jgi:hypothetical protein
MDALRNPAINEPIGLVLELSDDEKARTLAEWREKQRRDLRAREDYVLEIGREKVALAMLASGKPISEINQFTSLPEDKILSLRDSKTSGAS